MNLITNIEKADWFVSMPLREECAEQITQNLETGQREHGVLFSADLDVV